MQVKKKLALCAHCVTINTVAITLRKQGSYTMHAAEHYAKFSNAAAAHAAYNTLYAQLSQVAHVQLMRATNTVVVLRTFKKHNKAMRFVNNTIDNFWQVCNSYNADSNYDLEGTSDVISSTGYSTY